MAKNCVCCGRSISFFSGENQMCSGSEFFYCDSCFNNFREYIRIIKNVDESEVLKKAHAKMTEVIQGMDLPHNTLDIVSKDFNAYYEQRLPEAEESLRRKQQEDEAERLQAEAKEAKRKAEFELAQKEYEEARMQREQQASRIASVLVSTCDSIPGFRIVRHVDVVSGISSSLLSHTRYTGLEMNTKNMLIARQEALQSLREQACQLGANAVIGLSYETITGVEDHRMAVYADGTAVMVEPV